jgi:hypothetical protein
LATNDESLVCNDDDCTAPPAHIAPPQDETLSVCNTVATATDNSVANAVALTVDSDRNSSESMTGGGGKTPPALLLSKVEP